MAGLDKISGISPTQKERLSKARVRTTKDLLRQGSTPDGRKELAKETRISQQRITNWVHRADLARIKGINDDYARLLVRAGVESVVELSTQNPDELAEELQIAAAVERFEKRVPSDKVLQGWIEQARHLIRHVWYHDTWGDESITGRPPPRYAGPRY